MTQQQTGLIAGIATLVLLATAAAVGLLAPTPDQRAADAAALLAFVTAAAVGIERAIEAGWTIVGSLRGTFWPLNAVSRQVDAMVADLDASLKPFHEDVEKALGSLAAGGEWTQEKVEEARAEIEKLRRRFDGLKELPVDSQRAQLLAAAAGQNVNYLTKKYAGKVAGLNLEEAAAVANEAIGGLQTFAASFKDNPGRRLISLYAGAILGLGVAGVFGLDLFSAALQADASHPRLNVVLTGVVIGLGSSPTHEVIRVVQEFKKSRKGENIAKPDLPDKAQ
jgi:hypothetical protein